MTAGHNAGALSRTVLSDADRKVANGIVARINSPDGLERFETQLRAVRGCRRPVRLKGRVATITTAGKHTTQFDSRTLPDGVLLKACGTRRETLCPPCASLYRGDAFALVAAGLRGGKDVPESIGEHPAVLLTLTAPGFGEVHRRRSDGSCHPAGAPHPAGTRCQHGRPLVCRAHHGEGDPEVGGALCPDCYDYEGAVLFNAGVSELWRRTAIYALRSLGQLCGLSARQAVKQLRLSYVKVVEFQRRGSVHLHVLVRLDGKGEEHGDPVEGIDAGMLAAALRIAARKVSAPMAGRDDGTRMTWGEQVDAAPVTEAENGRRRAAAYLAKYSAKGSDADGVLDHRFRSGPVRDTRLPDHLRTLAETAWELADRDELDDLRLRLWSHTCGFRGHFLTKSHRYSTTFGELREARQRWRVARLEIQPDEGLDLDGIELREWTYEGSGYLTAGDACLAGTVEEGLRIGRWLSREDDDSLTVGERSS